jgi:hypothetical protein
VRRGNGIEKVERRKLEVREDWNRKDKKIKSWKRRRLGPDLLGQGRQQKCATQQGARRLIDEVLNESYHGWARVGAKARKEENCWW